MVVQRTYTQAELEEAVEKARSEVREENFSEGRSRERARLSAILSSQEAKGREALAQKFAFETDMNAEQAIGLLRTLPQTPNQSLPDDRARNAPGGLVVEGAQAADRDPTIGPKSDFDRGREIASRMPAGLRG